MSTSINITPSPALPPPVLERGAVGWAHANLFSSWFNGALTATAAVLIGIATWFSLTWAFGPADWQVIGTLGGRLFMGQYNTEAACPGQDCFWRPQAALLLVIVLLGMAWGIAGGGLTKRIALLVTAALAALALLPYSFNTMGLDVRILLLLNVPALAAGYALARYTPLGQPRWVAALAVFVFLVTLVLMRGMDGVPGLQPVEIVYWGGFMLNLLLAVAGIALSFPLGIALALGRRSNLPVVKALCVSFIEIFRGVPLITLLFMAHVLVPLALPTDLQHNAFLRSLQNPLLRSAVVITLFSAAYMAENIRGGLQALHRGQREAALSLGLPNWEITLFITLPQAIRNVIPAIVGQFISLFKDTSLVYIVGMQDVVEISRSFVQGNPEYLPSAQEMFVFLAFMFWIFTYGMSYVSQRIESHLGVGRR